MENTEEEVSLNFADRCRYISNEEYKDSEEKGRMLNHLVENPEKYTEIIANCNLLFANFKYLFCRF